MLTKKSNKSGNLNSQISYQKWASGSLDIQLERGTKILNIENTDPDKKFILNT